MTLRLRTETTSSSSSSASSTESGAGSSNALAAASAPSGDGLTQDQRAGGIANDTRRQVYEEHRANIPEMQLQLGDRQWSAQRFLEVWTTNRGRYEHVAQATGVPAELIAALHFRESSGNFNTYLHNGQPLGQVTTIVPVGIYFEDWEEAAIDALRSKQHVANDLSMNAETTDLAAMATYAEYYNGLGYHYRGYESAYVYAGTDQYTGGKFVRDGVFDPNAQDAQLGVMAMIQLARGAEPDGQAAGGGAQGGAPTQAGPISEGGWLRRGAQGARVEELQRVLTALGYRVTVDGDFGPRTEDAVRRFQAAAGLQVDGVVGPTTLGALNGRLASGGGQPEAAPTMSGGSLAALVAQMGMGVLKKGARGSAVVALQRALFVCGHRVSADGVFGPMTEAAVKAVQAAAGLVVDGIVGPQTRRAFLHGDEAPAPAPAPTPEAGGAPAPAGPAEGEGVVGPEPEREVAAEGDTERERELDTFFQAFNGIAVRVNPGQSPARYVDVIPSYHINAGDRRDNALTERARNPAVAAIVNQLPPEARMGKATPADIRTFLERSIAAGLVADTSALGLRDFLARFGVGTDCSGLVSQALNYLHDGNLQIDDADLLDPMYTGSGSLRGGQGQFDRVGAPRDLVAGDTMHIPGHIRILVDVDVNGAEVTFRTIESSPREDVVEPDQRDAQDARRADGGIGDVHWRYADGGRFSGLQRSADGGRTWAASSESPTYGRWRNMPAQA